MAEQAMRQHVVRALKPLHAISVENLVYPGTPDVNYADGWIELKHVQCWPVRSTTPLRVPHFTQEQKAWLRMRHRRSTKVHVLLQVANEWFLLDAPTACAILGQSTRTELTSQAERVWTSKPTNKELLQCFSN